MNKQKAIILIILLVGIVVGLFLGFRFSSILNENKTSESHQEEKKKYSFKYYDIGLINYDEMTYLNGFYYKEILNYDDFVKSYFSKVIQDVSEKDFRNKFMVVIAVENTSKLNLVVSDLYKDNDNLIIEFDYGENNEGFNSYRNSSVILVDNDLKSSNIEMINTNEDAL